MGNRRNQKKKPTSEVPIVKRGRPPKRAKTITPEVEVQPEAGPEQGLNIEIPSSPTPSLSHSRRPSIISENQDISVRFVQGLLGDKPLGVQKKGTKRKPEENYDSDSISSIDQPAEDNAPGM